MQTTVLIGPVASVHAIFRLLGVHVSILESDTRLAFISLNTAEVPFGCLKLGMNALIFYSYYAKI
jgi:hypothetical protein